eukprot:m.671717 g.671717  ORF g.671717 m.671717 type:complete len:77 (+) comp58530_c0_seq86:2113-2343(+)
MSFANKTFNVAACPMPAALPSASWKTQGLVSDKDSGLGKSNGSTRSTSPMATAQSNLSAGSSVSGEGFAPAATNNS